MAAMKLLAHPHEPAKLKAASASSAPHAWPKQPFYLRGVGSFPYEEKMNKPMSFSKDRYKPIYKRLDKEQFSVRDVPQNSSSWMLPGKMAHPVRNHDSLILERQGQAFLVNILGRWSRYVQVRDLFTGAAWAVRSEGQDPLGRPLDDLNHVYSVLLDKINGTGKEAWLTCGFTGDQVNHEQAVQYARIVDLETLEVRVGPKLPYPGGACVALALEIVKGEPPMICSFGGTAASHDSGLFQPYSACYDRLREKFVFPFGRFERGFDHGSVSLIPKGTCAEKDPARLLILNYRDEAYGTQRREMLAFDIPEKGWTPQKLARMDMERYGKWYLYHNETYERHRDARRTPRDASGLVSANGGRAVLNFGGIHYWYPQNRTTGKVKERKGHVFDAVRSFDVCEKNWTVVGRLGLPTFALQTAASETLQIAVTCGGDAIYQDQNQPWCMAHRFGADLHLANRHGAPALSGFVPGPVEGLRHE